MSLTSEYVWEKTFGRFDIATLGVDNDDLQQLCDIIVVSRNNGRLSNNQVSNLLRSIHRDIVNNHSAWKGLLFNVTYGEFLDGLKMYQQCRIEFKSRDKQPLDPMCLPLSNEIMYGKGLNSKVRDVYAENQ